MGDREQLKILDEKFLERKHLLSAIIERLLDNESYYGLSFTSLRVIRMAVGCIPGTDSDQIDEINTVSDLTIYPM